MSTTLACSFRADESARSGLRGLLEAGLAPASLRVAASDASRAAQLAQETGARADIDPADPLRGGHGLASGGGRAGVDMGALIGGFVGALVGLVIGYSPAAAVVPVAAQARPFADCLLFFVLGAIAGAVLGGALGRQSSIHAGFRLIDALEDGAVVIIADVPFERAAEAARVMASCGGADFVRLTPR
ncbi:MAG: hypothetical protein GIW99_08275 [Candidatus Eremiobacteraeota bacterium]|nr:hypothetical protein [Candidatus Eremiobacteraeota bacterium]MBC5827659.1 hypothetical protein [Candidatus Eremiobacteraeota bacterium]